MNLKQPVFLLLFIFAGANFTFSQDSHISKSTLEAVVNEIAQQLKSDYVFPEVADKMANQITRNLQNGNYNNLSDPNEVSERLTEELYAISKDNHIRVRFNQEMNKDLRGGNPNDDPEPAVLEKWKKEEAKKNFRFSKVEILEGNIGLITLNGFSDFMEEAGKVADAAMAYVANSDAIIFDLRSNPGGSPAMIRHLQSYLFKNPTHLNSFYFRMEDKLTESWTTKEVNGKKMDQTPVYVLISNRSFSAAEEFTYNLKHLKRATVIGEISGGGANPGGYVAIDNDFVIFIPTGRAINPLTKTNWEGVGVIPHIKVSKEKALDVAHLEALKTISKTATEKEKAYLTLLIENKTGLAKNISLSTEDLKKYTGEYGVERIRKITIEKETLYISSNGVSMPLKPMGDHLFLTDSNIRIQFNMASDNKITGLKILIPNGPTRDCPKN